MGEAFSDHAFGEEDDDDKHVANKAESGQSQQHVNLDVAKGKKVDVRSDLTDIIIIS